MFGTGGRSPQAEFLREVELDAFLSDAQTAVEDPPGAFSLLQGRPEAGPKCLPGRETRTDRAEEVAEVVLFLALEAASFITDAALAVNGGLSAAIVGVY